VTRVEPAYGFSNSKTSLGQHAHLRQDVHLPQRRQQLSIPRYQRLVFAPQSPKCIGAPIGIRGRRQIKRLVAASSRLTNSSMSETK
jgi:hypothetical protein